MHGNMNVKEIDVAFSLKKMLGKYVVKVPYRAILRLSMCYICMRPNTQ